MIAFTLCLKPLLPFVLFTYWWLWDQLRANKRIVRSDGRRYRWRWTLPVRNSPLDSTIPVPRRVSFATVYNPVPLMGRPSKVQYRPYGTRTSWRGYPSNDKIAMKRRDSPNIITHNVASGGNKWNTTRQMPFGASLWNLPDWSWW